MKICEALSLKTCSEVFLNLSNLSFHPSASSDPDPPASLPWGPCDYTELSQIIQGHFPILRPNQGLTFMKLQVSLPYKATYSQFLGIKVWTFVYHTKSLLYTLTLSAWFFQTSYTSNY